MSIAQFALSERTIADSRVEMRGGKTPATRVATARSDQPVIPEAR